MLLRKFKIQGHSMEPELKEGDAVLVSSIPYIFFKPKPGDVIAFNYFNKVLIKRIKKSKGRGHLIEGDNITDTLKIGWIDKKDIIGKVIFEGIG